MNNANFLNLVLLFFNYFIYKYINFVSFFYNDPCIVPMKPENVRNPVSSLAKRLLSMVAKLFLIIAPW